MSLGLLRTADGRSRRKAPIADRGLGRLNWAETAVRGKARFPGVLRRSRSRLRRQRYVDSGRRWHWSVRIRRSNGRTPSLAGDHR